MKKLFPYIIFSLLLILSTSCNKDEYFDHFSVNDSVEIKTVSIYLGIPETKSDKGQEQDICVMIYRNGVFYKKISPGSKSFSVDLMFNEKGDYKYDFYAYVNYGEYVGKDLPFEQEEKGLTSYGELLGITKDNVNSIVIEMKHNVNKVTVNSIKIDPSFIDPLFNNLLKDDFILNIDVFIIGAPRYFGGEEYYNDKTDGNLCTSYYFSEKSELYILGDELYYYDNEKVILVVEMYISQIYTLSLGKISTSKYYRIPLCDGVLNKNENKYLDIELNSEGYDNFLVPNLDELIDVDVVTTTYNMVDLGLPSGLKWADRNVGASSPEDYGLYFQWGDTVGYTAEQVGVDKVFDWGNYFDTTDGGDTFNKYAPDKLIVLEASDDAATVNMGSDWRMPTEDELQELIDNTTATFIDLQGNEFSQFEAENGAIANYNLKGVRFIGSNGNSIFIPASGYCSGGAGSSCGLWASDLYPGNSCYARYLYFNSYGNLHFDFGFRCDGLSVRGVRN